MVTLYLTYIINFALHLYPRQECRFQEKLVYSLSATENFRQKAF